MTGLHHGGGVKGTHVVDFNSPLDPRIRIESPVSSMDKALTVPGRAVKDLTNSKQGC
jgi:hypothetical protein